MKSLPDVLTGDELLLLDYPGDDEAVHHLLEEGASSTLEITIEIFIENVVFPPHPRGVASTERVARHVCHEIKHLELLL